MTGLQTVPIGTQKMQELFEEEGLRTPGLFGIRAIEWKVREPGSNAPEMPFGSLSVELSYREVEGGHERATAHVYKLPDESYRGTPDPKTLRIDNTLYVLDPDLP